MRQVHHPVNPLRPSLTYPATPLLPCPSARWYGQSVTMNPYRTLECVGVRVSTTYRPNPVIRRDRKNDGKRKCPDQHRYVPVADCTQQCAPLSRNRPEQVNNQSEIVIFRSRDWLSANQGPVFPDSVGSCNTHTHTHA
eukprot:sb/3474475/